MGIKTRFSSMGGDATGGGEPRPDIPDAWSYTTRTNEAGKEVRTLYFYNNAIGGDVVKVPYGYTKLQDYSYSTNNVYSSLPFYNHYTLTSVDLKKVPFKNNSMYRAFYNCQNLTSVNGINKNVTNMCGTFDSCYNLNQNIQIPNSVTNMANTFASCYSLNQNIQIPNSVTSMHGTFYYCTHLNQNIQIPSSVTSMQYTFDNCHILNQNIKIPNSVTNMYSTFFNCHNLNQNIQIPSSVTSMHGTFYNCQNLNHNIKIPNAVTNMYSTFDNCHRLNQNIQIPNSVTSMRYTFYHCHNLGSYHKTINILSEEVSDAMGAFYYTSYYNISNQLTIVFPLRYINNVNTVTRNSLVSAGYAVGAGIGVTAANTSASYNLKCFDWIAGDWNTYTGNGTHWQLTKWNGALTTHFNNGVAPIDLTFPNRLTTYATFPTVINISTYTGNTVINSIKVTKDVPWVSDRTGWYKNSKSRGGAFKGCTGLTHANVYINDSVIGMQETFMSCTNLRTVDTHLSNAGTSTFCFFYHCDSLVNAYSSDRQSTLITEGLVKPEHIASNLNVASVHIPSTVTNVQSMYEGCNLIDTFLLDGEGITSMVGLRANISGLSTRNENIYIKSPLVTSIKDWHRGYNTSYRRNYYIPYMYANGTYTATHATLYAQTLMRNNATTNFYMYDISPYNSVADYVVTFTSPNLYLNTYRGMSHTPTTVNKSPFGGTVYMTNTTYTLNASITSLDCNDVPFATTPAYAFRNCHNLTSIKNLNIPNTVSNYQSVFENCSSLRHIGCPVPDGQAQAAYMYKGCTNLGLDGSETIVFGRNVVNFRQTFYGCSNFQGDIYFMCPTGSTSANKWNHTFTGYNASRSKNLWCYFTYSNGVNTSMYNLLKGTKLYNNNATSNFYIKNIGTQPLTNNYNFAYNKSYLAIRFIGSCEGSTLVIPSQLEVGGSYADSTSTVTTVTSLCNCFENTEFNRHVLIPSSVTNMYQTFYKCKYFNRNTQIPNSVTNMYSTFDNCHRLNQNIKIPSSVTTMTYTFYNCQNFNQNIQIPSSVTSMHGTFYNCQNLSSRIYILSQNITDAVDCFSATSLPKDVYIPYTYDNGEYTKTYNSFNTAGYFRGINGVTMHDLN